MANIKGAGGFFTREASGTLRLLRTATFELSSEVEQTDVSAFPVADCGPLQIVDSFINKTTWLVKVAPTSIEKGEMVWTGPGVEHATVFPVYTVLISMSLRPRDHASHEQDVVRLAEPLPIE